MWLVPEFFFRKLEPMNSSIDSLIREVETDDSLLSVRTLADKNLNGYSFNEKGVLIHSTVDELTNTHDRIVLP